MNAINPMTDTNRMHTYAAAARYARAVWEKINALRMKDVTNKKLEAVFWDATELVTMSRSRKFRRNPVETCNLVDEVAIAAAEAAAL